MDNLNSFDLSLISVVSRLDLQGYSCLEKVKVIIRTLINESFPTLENFAKTTKILRLAGQARREDKDSKTLQKVCFVSLKYGDPKYPINTIFIVFLALF